MAADWPSDLPQVYQQDGFSYDLVSDGLIEHQPSLGPPITRLGTSANVKGLSGWMKMDVDQIESLVEFVETELLYGSLPFNFPNQLLGSGTWLVKIPRGSFPRIVGVINEDTYRVSLTLVVLP